MSQQRYTGYRAIRTVSSTGGDNPTLQALGFNEDGYTWNDQRVPVNLLAGVGINSPDYAFFMNNGGPAAGQSARFDSSSEGVIPYAAPIDLPDSFSVGLWVRPDIAGGGLSRWLMDRPGHFSIRSTFNQKYVRLDVDGVGNIQTADNTLVDGVWTYITCVCEVSGGDTELTSLPTLDTSATNTGESPHLLGRVYRDGTNDTFAEPAFLMEFDCHARFVKMGSPLEGDDPNE